MTKPEKAKPQRTCIGCRQVRDKDRMIRIVRTPEGGFILDRTGHAAGRGAYLCDDADCLQRMIRTKGLDRAFHAKADAKAYEALREQMESGA